jgi:hypothetical protein
MTVVAHNAGGIEAVLLFLREKEEAQLSMYQ